MQFVIQFRIEDGDGYSHTITAPVVADSKESVINVIKSQGIKDVQIFKNIQLRESWDDTMVFVDIGGERIFGEGLFNEPKEFRILTIEEWFQMPLKGDEWVND